MCAWNKSRGWAWLSAAILLIAAAVGILHGYLGERPTDYLGPRAWLDASFAVVLLLVVLLFSSGIGWIVLARLGLQEDKNLETELAALALGLGIVAYGVLVLGLCGELKPLALLGWLGLVGVVGFSNWRQRLSSLLRFNRPVTSYRQLDFDKKLLLLAGAGILALTFMQSLTPPWDYDSLQYHLDVPRQFLEQGRIASDPENWLTSIPLTIEMLYTLGMGLGSDVFSKLIQLSYSLMLVMGTYAFGKRFIGPRAAWLAAAILVGIPIFPIWASWSYVDMGMAAFTFLSTASVIYWAENRKTSWLAVAGTLMGFGLGSKYQCFGAAAALGVWLLWLSRKMGWRTILTNLVLFAGSALLVASPWYLKNWLWTGNPITPLIVGPVHWSSYHRDIWMSFMSGFGTGSTFWDFLLLPVNLYLHHERFATSAGTIEFPSLLFPLIIFYPWTKRTQTINGLLVISLVQFGIWAFVSQVNRFLLPIFPLLSLAVAHILVEFENRFQTGRLGFILSRGLVFSAVGVTLIYSLLFFAQIKPLGVVSGVESKDAFLRRVVGDYAAVQYIKSNLSPDSRVLMMWDGRGYYCDLRCLPDIDHSQWSEIVAQGPRVSSATNLLKARRVTHLLLGLEDADYLLQHDPKGYQRRALDFFLEEFRPACTRQIYADRWVRLYELTCLQPLRNDESTPLP